MQTFAEEIQIIIAATLLLFLIISFVVGFVFVNHYQYRKHVQEREEIKNVYQQEILKAQLEMKEQTLHTISQEIHDNIGQILSLVKLNLNTLVLEEPAQAREKVAVTKELVGKAIHDLRDLSKSLNTDHIAHQPLSGLLQSALKTIENPGSYHTSFCLKGIEHLLDPHKQLITFRIAQEALTNIIKHAKADQIRVELSYCPDGLTLVLKDNGVGFDPAVAAKAYTSGMEMPSMEMPSMEMPSMEMPGRGSGLDNIQYRARLIGAELKIESELNQGTAVIFTLPNQP